jgi:hypothetical protein
MSNDIHLSQLTPESQKSVYCGLGETLKITSERKALNNMRNSPLFTGIGKKYIDDVGEDAGFDFINVLVSLNTQARRLFQQLYVEMNYTNNICHMPWTKYSAPEKANLSRAYQGLKKVELVKRVRPGVYMINPNAVIHPKYFQKMLAKWNTLK